MRIGVFGTGGVGRALSAGFARAGHDVMIGTRDVEALMERTEGDQMGNPPFSVWHADHADVRVAPFAAAAAHGELLANATLGEGSIDALTAAGAENLDGKILIDTSNPLDRSSGFPPSLFVGNTDSLGEQIQRAFPSARVVKVFNSINANLMTDPGALGGGDHTLPLCGDDETAKAEVTGYLKDWFGWKDVVDLGDLTNARAMEAYLALWIRLFMAFGTPMINIKVVR